MKPSFLAQRGWFRLSNAMLILLMIFFLVPFALRGARMSLSKTENNVKDWLPADFRETTELEWFGRYFAGERFIIATWPGCTAEDQRLQLFEKKLEGEAVGAAPDPPPPDWDRARKTAEELGLLLPGDQHRNWGGRDEKWLVSEGGTWYFITPEGHLFRWAGEQNLPQSTLRAIKKGLGTFEVEGQFVAAFGGAAGERVANPYYNDPSLLTAALFKTVQTGPEVAAELATEGGPLWPVDLTARELRPQVAYRLAVRRLTGTLFAPPVPPGFDWSPDSFAAVLPEERRDELPENYEQIVAATVARHLEARFDGQLRELQEAATGPQTDVWLAVFDKLGVEPPARQTSVMVTLTDVGQRNLPYVVGRGVLGGPRGRMLTLAAESGLEPPASPSLAPPPFNEPEEIGASGRPPLLLGGPPVDNVAIDEEGTITLARLVGYSLLLGIGLSYLCFRSIKVTIMVFFVGGLAAALSLSIVWWSGAGVDAIMMSMPSLVYVLGLSGAIHVVNYYRDEYEVRGQAGAAGRALRHALIPCTLAAFTTAIGLMSLYTSNIIPIRKFGWFSAVGVIATLGILFTYLPAALEVFVPNFRKNSQQRKAKSRSTSPDDFSPADAPPSEAATAVHEELADGGLLASFWLAVGRFVVKHHAVVSLTCLTGFIALALGVPKIKTSVQLLKLFGAQSRIIHDYGWMEENFGKLVPMELVVRVPPEQIERPRVAGAAADGPAPSAADDDAPTPNAEPADGDAADQETATEAGAEQRRSPAPLNALERVETVARIQTVVEQAFGEAGMDVVGRAMSAATFLPELPPPTNDAHDPMRYRFNREIQAAIRDLIGSDYLRIEQTGPLEGSELWRISLRVGALSDVDYGTFVYDLRRAVEPILEAYRTRNEIVAQLQSISTPGTRTIAVLGRSAPRPLGDEPILVEEVDEETGLRTWTIDERAIYDATLAELLRNVSMTRVIWNDPTAGALAGKATSDQWGRMLAGVDLVLLLHEHQDYNAPFIEEHAQRFVDLRQVDMERSVPAIIDGVPVPTDSGPLQVVYTGVVPVVYKAQRTLLTSLIESIAWAFVLIGTVMVVLLHPGRGPIDWFKPRLLGLSVLAGLIAMIPNIFPVAIVFGAMGHMGTLVDIGTMMTASVAMGVAVDDTIHFLSWFRQYLDQGMSRLEAVIVTYRRVGPAMTQTTIVGGLGLFVFSLSTFTPTQRFGTLMLVLLATALIGDLIFLPALLAGPLGRFFRPRTGNDTGADDDAGAAPDANSAQDASEDRERTGKSRQADTSTSASDETTSPDREEERRSTDSRTHIIDTQPSNTRPTPSSRRRQNVNRDR